MGELILYIIILIGSILGFISTLSLKSVPMLDSIVGPALFPQIALAMIIISCCALIAKIVIGKTKNEFIFIELFQGKRLGFGVLTFIYIATINLLGFATSTAIYLTLTINYLYFTKGKPVSCKKMIIICVVSIISSIALYLFFYDMMGILLPRGTLF